MGEVGVYLFAEIFFLAIFYYEIKYVSIAYSLHMYIHCQTHAHSEQMDQSNEYDG